MDNRQGAVEIMNDYVDESMASHKHADHDYVESRHSSSRGNDAINANPSQASLIGLVNPKKPLHIVKPVLTDAQGPSKRELSNKKRGSSSKPS